jgi:uncharacterized protein with von Willebrand factor type A (vWA) domain
VIFEHDQFDDEAFESALGSDPELGGLVDKFPRGFVQDIFNSLFKLHPTVSQKKLPPFLEKHKQFVEEMMQTAEWKQLRSTSALNVDAAALGAASLAKGLVDQIPDDADDARQLVRGLLERASTELGELLDLAEGWSTSSGVGGQANIAVARDLAAHVRRSSRLQQIAELAGRMRRIALHKHRTRTKHSADEICDVELGNDVGRVLPSELVALKNRSLRLDFFRRFAERSLLQYKLVGTEKVGRGPIVVCIDSSGSMEGSKDIWAKAVALGLLAIAQEENRDFAIVHFGSVNQIRTWQFDRPVDPLVVAESLDWFFDGGTNFETPLTTALEIQTQARFEKGDVIFITDGLCEVRDEFMARFNATRRERGVCVYSVLINCGSAAGTAVSKFSDGVEVLTDMAKDDGVLDMVFGL